VRLQSGLKTKLAKVAEEMGINTSTLARMWIVEKINGQATK
jgi:antitoxin component of RelBE/YafQ-DinJ toxin-antitoxin module